MGGVHSRARGQSPKQGSRPTISVKFYCSPSHAHSLVLVSLPLVNKSRYVVIPSTCCVSNSSLVLSDQRPVWKQPNTSVVAGEPSSSSAPVPSNTTPSTLAAAAAVVVGTTSLGTSASTADEVRPVEEDEEEDEENLFGPDDDVIGGLIRDPLAPAPVPQPIPPIVVPLLPPLLRAPIPQPAVEPQPAIEPQPLLVIPPQPDIPNVLPPQAYVIVPNPAGGAPQLNPQHNHVIRTIRASIPRLELYLTTDIAFPDSFVASQFLSTTLITSADNLGHTGLVVRMQSTDQDFLRVMIALVSTCSHT